TIHDIALGKNQDVLEASAFAVPGVRATLVICRLKLRVGADPEALVEKVLDQARRVWFDPSTSLLETIPSGWTQTQQGPVMRRASSANLLSSNQEAVELAQLERSRVRLLCHIEPYSKVP